MSKNTVVKGEAAFDYTVLLFLFMQAENLTALQLQQGTSQLHVGGFVPSVDVQHAASMAVVDGPAQSPLLEEKEERPYF